MDDDELVLYMESQLQATLGHLNSISHGDAAAAPAHRLEARRAYDSIMTLLPKVALSGKRRIDFLARLSELRNRLALAGEEL
ncbi:MAG TPA: hypothetical protein VGL55_02665 [Steroidobacteraceae bacterium]|jgi:hypothetical protein